MFVLCALAGLSAADPRLFLPGAVAPGQLPAVRYGAARVPLDAHTPGAAYSVEAPALAMGAARGAQLPAPVAAPASMPSAWAYTGALLVGLSAYGVVRAATSGAAETADRQSMKSPLARRASNISMGLDVGDKFPPSALAKCGVSGKNAVVFFYGADDAPSCSKEIGAFGGALDVFEGAGVSVVGVRNAKGAKDIETPVKLVIDEEDAMREEIGIEKDLFGLLGGRETYVVDKSGTVVSVHNNQFDPGSHVSVAVDALDDLPKASNPLEDFLAQFKK